MIEVVYNCNHIFSGLVGFKASILLSTVLLVLFSFFYIKNFYKDGFNCNVGFFLILFGSISNIFEWVRNGCVRDYVNFFGLFHFNLADFAITIGVFIIFYQLWKKE